MSGEPAPAGEPPRARARAALPGTVIGLGLVSLFTDASSEAIFPLLPAFLVPGGAAPGGTAPGRTGT